MKKEIIIGAFLGAILGGFVVMGLDYYRNLETLCENHIDGKPACIHIVETARKKSPLYKWIFFLQYVKSGEPNPHVVKEVAESACNFKVAGGPEFLKQLCFIGVMSEISSKYD